MRNFILLAFCGLSTLASAQNIPVVGASLPVDYDEWPYLDWSGDNCYIYKREYKGVQLNADGSLSNYSGTDYIQMASGIMDSYIYDMVAGSDANHWNEGTLYYRDGKNRLFFSERYWGNGDNEEIPDYDGIPMIGSVKVVQGGDGKNIFVFGEEWINFVVLGDYPVPDDPDFPMLPLPYDSLSCSVPYTYFVENNGVSSVVDNRAQTYSKMMFTGKTTPKPPHKAEQKTYQMVSMGPNAFIGNEEGPHVNLQGRFVKLIITDTDVYVQGLFQEGRNLWVKGTIDGDRVTFHRGDVAAIGDEIRYLGSYTWDSAYDPATDTCTSVFTPSGNDITFILDGQTLRAADDRQAILLTADIDKPVEYTCSAMKPVAIPAIISPKLSPYEDRSLTPGMPCFLGINHLDWGSSVIDYVMSDVSEEGDLMVSDKLFYTITINGENLEFYTKDGFWPDGKVSPEIPYGFNTLSLHENGDCRIDGYWRRMLAFYMTSAEELKKKHIEIQMIYKGGGEETVSKIAVGGNPDSVDEISTGDDEPMEVYSLNGVRIGNTLEGLHKGIYIIRQGQKTTKVAL